MLGDLWSDADIIDIYTRRQAIKDGVLVQLSGPGYQGDPWVSAMVAEAGFRYPVAMTATASCRYVSSLEGDDEKLAPCQDIEGRLWDVLWMLKAAIRGIQAPRAILHFSLRVVPNVPTDYSKPNTRGLRVVAGDTAVACAKNIFRPEQIELSGGGGTDMAAMIVAACEERLSPKAVLVVTDGYTGWPPKPVGPRVVACLTQARTAEKVPKWIDSVVLNPAD